MNRHETHVPTFEEKAQAQIWIPGSDEDHCGEKSDQTPPQNRPESPVRLKFPKSKRLLKRRQFQRISYERNRLVGKYLCIDYRKGASLKLGITASTKYGISPVRNRFKRLVREAFRLSFPLLPQKIEINIVPRQLAKKAKLADIQNELLRLLSC